MSHLSSDWAATKALGADHVVLLHMPQRGNDPAGLWPAVEGILAEAPGPTVIPEMDSVIYI